MAPATTSYIAAGSAAVCLAVLTFGIWVTSSRARSYGSDTRRRRKMRKLLLTRPPSSSGSVESSEYSFASDVQTWAAFICHCKSDCAMVARVLQNELEDFLGQPVFLDSDDLLDLRMLRSYVCRSNVIVLCLSLNVLTRPYCLLEVLAAIDAEVPVVALELTEGPAQYNVESATELLRNLPSQLDMDAARILREHGVSLHEAAIKLSTVVLQAPCVRFNPFAAAPDLVDAIGQLAEEIRTARPLSVSLAELSGLPPSRGDSFANGAEFNADTLDACRLPGLRSSRSANT